MDIFNVLELLCGLALFLYGMNVMGDALKKSAGNRLKFILGKMTSNPVKGFLLGLIVTCVIQSSSATTVMVVGFVNSGTMSLLQSVGVIMGANVGTAITAWITGLSGLGADGETVSAALQWLKPSAWMPIIAVIGICLSMFAKRGKKKDFANILLGFAVLMVGMDLMSASVGGLKESESFKSILTMFENPILGVIAGLVLTAIVQSSSASVGILQSLTVTGAITYSAAIPIIMGQNIGTCVTAMISSVGASRDGKRAAFVHLYFNIIGVVIWLSVFSIVKAVATIPLFSSAIDMWGVAAVHTIFKILCVIIMGPFYKLLAKLACATVKDKQDKSEMVSLLDERLFSTPSIALGQAQKVSLRMADISYKSLKKALTLFENYDTKLAEEIRDLEDKGDKYEDALGSYLVKLSACDMPENDATQITKLLHTIGDLERISDHAVNIVESAEEIMDKRIEFSQEAKRELHVMRLAIEEILDITYDSLVNNDIALAANVEPLEEVVDDLRDAIKLNHVRRLQKSECTIEHGFVLSDILTNFERVSDHCANIAGCVIEIAKFDALDMHKYTDSMKHGNSEFTEKYKSYSTKYSI